MFRQHSLRRGNLHRVAVTGMGWHTSLGSTLPACWNRLIAGENGIRRISRWDSAQYTVHVAAETSEEQPAEISTEFLPARSCKRAVRLFQGVAQEAFLDAKLDRAPLPADEIGVAAGNSVSYLDMRLLKHYFQLRKNDRLMVDLARCSGASAAESGSFYRRLGDLMASRPAKLLRLNGPCFVLDTACAASGHAIGEAFRMVARGRVKAMIAGGAAALVSPLSILAFALIGALSRSESPEEASRPFDRGRDGFVMGEGAGAVVLESMESAQERGAHIYAEIAGYASSLNAHSLADPSPSGDIEARTMTSALADAALAPEEVGYIAAHGTSTPKNDSMETAAIKTAFGRHARRIMISSNKGQIGHTISAAGVCNVICAVKAISDSMAPPTMHLKNADPDCDLDYVANQSRPGAVRAALANAFAFGGQNAVLVIRTAGEIH